MERTMKREKGTKVGSSESTMSNVRRFVCRPIPLALAAAMMSMPAAAIDSVALGTNVSPALTRARSATTPSMRWPTGRRPGRKARPRQPVQLARAGIAARIVAVDLGE